MGSAQPRLNAANALSGTTLPLTQAQYGASVGGPIVHDRTFFFTNFEQRQLNQNGIITIKASDAAAINTRLQTVGYQGPLLAVSSTTPSQHCTRILFAPVIFLRRSITA